jgi:hypothetical protein
MNEEWDGFWKQDWELTRERFRAWWQHDGLILHVTAPCDEPRIHGVSPERIWGGSSGIDTNYPFSGHEPVSLETAWLDPERRAQLAELDLARTFWGGEAFPYFDTHIGPGSLGMFLGVEAELAPDTVWYKPCITDPDSQPPLKFDPQHPWFLKHRAIIEAGMRRSRGHYLVGMPDLIENVDTLAALRGTDALLIDMIERPDWVKQRVAEINQAYFEAFDHLFEIIQDPWGGNAFSAFKIWGAGRTAKVQCDMAAMISPKMFAEFVVPALSEQCEWLDYSLYHLDGTQAIIHLDRLLEIDVLDAIEWTPQAGHPQGGDPEWYGLYRRVLAGGKSVQAIDVRPEEVIPLLDAIGTHGVYIMTEAKTEVEARALVEAVEAYR